MGRHHALTWSDGESRLSVEPWGTDAVRVRATPNPDWIDLPHALLDPNPVASRLEEAEGVLTLTNGRLTVQCDAKGRLHFLRTDGATLTEEQPRGRRFAAVGDGRYAISTRFKAYDGERLYGLGQHQHGRLDQKGCVLDLRQENTQVAIPLMVSSRGYAFMWNHPGTGKAYLGVNRTEWTADRSPQLDYWIAAGDTPADLMRRYGEATGLPPTMPDWAAGFWQCKLRYQSQDELLDVAREFKRRGIPLSVLVIDYFHWSMMGDFRFDATEWPDPAGMVNELREMGIEPAVSVWPTLNPWSENAREMVERGLLVRGRRGGDQVSFMMDKPHRKWTRLQLYDATNPAARDFVWSRIKANYHDHGLRCFWLDACEPEVTPNEPDNLIYHAGRGDEVGLRYPLDHQRAFYDGLKAAGEEHVVTLCRSAWLGSQRYGAIVWSGDIEATWRSLNESVRVGLNMAMSGIPWWTTDIGGFKGGDSSDPAYRELMIRWFQYGTFCPVFRLHGNREPRTMFSGGPNEPWSYGEEAEAILTSFIRLRYRILDYVLDQMRHASRTGTPPMRPLWFDRPDDPDAAIVDDAFLLGPDLLVAPVLEAGAKQRRVYLPSGSLWHDAWTGERHDGGQWVDADTPIERLPLFLRNDCRLAVRAD